MISGLQLLLHEDHLDVLRVLKDDGQQKAAEEEEHAKAQDVGVSLLICFIGMRDGSDLDGSDDH
ncbi:hypothetical protein TYRP_006259 [Tyrophagus putrescentiae]|nr:hypothetical protein TYRP_006259 [Tyrophagus putrescentiae]